MEQCGAEGGAMWSSRLSLHFWKQTNQSATDGTYCWLKILVIHRVSGPKPFILWRCLVGFGDTDVCNRVDQLPIFPYNRGWSSTQ